MLLRVKMKTKINFIKDNIPFTQISNFVLSDKNLSFGAKGLYAYIYSKPDGWQFAVDRIEKETKDGRDSILSKIHELEESKLLRRIKQPDGRTVYWVTFPPNSFITLEPTTENPYLDSRANYGKTQVGKTRSISNKYCISNKYNTHATKVARNLKAKKKTMKKNSFNYNENNMSDSYEDVIDLESGSIVSEKKNTNDKVVELVKWAENRRGSKFMSKPKQYKFIQRLKFSEQKITPEDIKKRWIETEQDPYWSKIGFDFGTIFSSFDKKPIK
jgi:hypothetical protein